MVVLSSNSQPSRLRERSSPQKLSPLFHGHNVTAHLQNSSFGLFSSYLEDITEHLPAVSFKLPCVIVVGSKSAGKSSLLEMITKCAIFPRHSDFCTKLPIKLRMRPAATLAQSSVSIKFASQQQELEVSEIAAKIHRIMAETNGISNQEIVVEMCKVGMPNFELIDLPGLQTFPAERYQATTELIMNYLQQPDTLVLCVVDATTPALDSSLALKMIKDADKLGSTILALTKSDLVASEIGQVENIFDRVLRQSAESEHLEGLAGCVAVASRDCTDRISLREADSVERQVFEAMLADPADAFAPEMVQKQLRQNMGSKQLIMKLDVLFHDHIVRRWKPAALQHLQDVIQQTEGHIADLGMPIETLDQQDVLHYIQQQVAFDSLCSSMRRQVKDTNLLQLAATFDHKPWGTPGWAKEGADLHQDISARMRPAALKAAHLRHGLGPLVYHKFFTVIRANDPGYRLQRFTSLQPALKSLLNRCVQDAFNAAAPTISVMTNEAIGKCYADKTSVTQSISSLFQAVDGCILSYIIPALKLHDLKVPPDFQLEENAEVQRARVTLNKQLLALTEAHHRISLIEQNMDDVRQQSVAMSDCQLESFYSTGSMTVGSEGEDDQGGVDQQDLQPKAQGSKDKNADLDDKQAHANSSLLAYGNQLESGDVDQHSFHPEGQSTQTQPCDQLRQCDNVQHGNMLTGTGVEMSLPLVAASIADAEGFFVAQTEAYPFDDVPISPISSVADSFVHIEWENTVGNTGQSK